ncbi:hypothetical protein BR93DRAFT_963547 [Coniochaeta sp. PMI_546]|nr:hypothetical protein BR93DRAFT_963547 [Coniochaeta sp. PMI_546]
MSRIEKTKEVDLKNRIRDNQRRSRQKRKEHLQEIEDKLRQCQFQGVEASIEIQAEARRVAEENKKLRTLLNRHGVPDESINEFLFSGTVVPPRHPPSDYLHPAAVSGNVQSLERLLEPRRPRCLEPSEPFSAPSDVGGCCSKPADASATLKGRETSIASSCAVWEIPARPEGLPSSVSRSGVRIQPVQYMAAPGSETILSRTDAAMALKGLGSTKADPRSPTTSNMASASLTGVLHSQQPYDYNVHLYSNPSGYDPPHAARQRLSLQVAASSASVPSNYMQAQPGENNCALDADMISRMSGVDPHHVRGQLGCMPGIDCHVDPANFSNLMDRYTTATTMGM